MVTLKDDDSILPENLKGVWDDAAADLFYSLSLNEQTFVLGILKGKRKGQAYKDAYPNVSDASKGACASGLLKRPKIVEFLNYFRDTNLEDFFLVHHRLQSIISGEVMEVEVNGIKIPVVPSVKDMNTAAATLAKISGLNAPEKIQDDRFSALLQHMKERNSNGQETKAT